VENVKDKYFCFGINKHYAVTANELIPLRRRVKCNQFAQHFFALLWGD